MEEYNIYYSFIREAIICYYNKCCENCYNSYYSRILDRNISCESYLDFLELMYKNFMKGIK